MDIIEEVIKSTNLKPVIEFFTPEKSAEIIKSLLKIYEEIYGEEAIDSQFTMYAFERIVISHSGWKTYLEASQSDTEKIFHYHSISMMLYQAGRDHLIKTSEAE